MRVPLASKICHTKSILLHHNKYHLVKTTLISTKKMCRETHRVNQMIGVIYISYIDTPAKKTYIDASH
jgi:hypothetical protein